MSFGKILNDLPFSDKSLSTVTNFRNEISDVLNNRDNRLLVVVGPCSIHDIDSTKEYINLLRTQYQKFKKELILVMRMYFEKPRTVTGWKGLIKDPDLNGLCNVDKGLRISRSLLTYGTTLGLPCATEFLDLFTSQYISDFISLGVIGARTVESQMYREFASSMPFPMGFKNNTSGDVNVAINALKSASTPQCILSYNESKGIKVLKTSGNLNTCVILRGGKGTTNYDNTCISTVSNKLRKHKLIDRVIVDCSHDNSYKDYRNQTLVVKNVCKQLCEGARNIKGVMIEGNIYSGKQPISSKNLEYGKSVTDGCISWQETVELLEELAYNIKNSRFV